MIQEQYVSFEIAKLLKEKGFDEYGMYFYTLKDNGCEGYKSNKTLGEFAHNSNPDLKDRAVSCPTQQMAMAWLRKIHKLHITVFSSSQESWMYRITKPHQHLEDGVYAEDFYSYEAAVEAAIKYCLENLI